MILTLLRGVIVLVPMFILLPMLFPTWGMWAAIPASEILTPVVIVVISLSGRSAGGNASRDKVRP